MRRNAFSKDIAVGVAVGCLWLTVSRSAGADECTGDLQFVLVDSVPAGKSCTIRIAIMAITTSRSTKVNARDDLRLMAGVFIGTLQNPS